jgi:hypothetical protein
MTDFNTKFVLQSLDGGVASFNAVAPERGKAIPAIPGAYCTLTIADEELAGALTVGDVFEVSFTQPKAAAPKKAAKVVIEEAPAEAPADTTQGAE